jgi:AcrR family transcriptional regulator
MPTSQSPPPAQTRGASREKNTSNTRELLLEVAVPRFLARGFEAVSVAEVAKAANAFPNHVTYHFGGKEGLFVEAAAYAMLRAAKQAEKASRRSTSVEDHTRLLISNLLGPNSAAVMLFGEAMLLARRKPNLSERIREALQQLNDAGETAMVLTLMRTGWKTRVSPDVITRSFWAAIFGLALQKAAMGQDFEQGSSEAVALLMINLNGALGAKRHVTPLP